MKTNNLLVLACAAALVFTSGGTAQAASDPIAATGWNADFILGNGETHAAHAKPQNANIWFAEDSTVTPSVSTDGIVATGAVTIGGVNFQFQPFTGYGNNSLRGTGTLTLTTPGTFSAISFLGSSPSGNPTVTLKFSDNSTTSLGTVTFIAWTGTGDLNPRLTGNGTTAAYTGGINKKTYALSGTDQGKTLVSISFSGGAGAVFALSGEPAVGDTVPPIPSPMAFAAAPASYNATTVVMTATTATDAQTPPVQYYFENTTNSDNSGWISSAFWPNTGLTTDVTYSYRVKARDGAIPPNETGWSDVATATPVHETAAPTPNPMTFATSQPGGGDGTTMTLTATTASDATPPVYYEFENLTNGHTRAWDTSPVWTDTGLTPGTEYSYRVRARDSESPANTGEWSAVTTARPQLAASYVYEANPSTFPDNRGDTGLTELTDSQLPPDGATWNYPQNAGFLDIEPQIRFDLGAIYNVATIDVTYWASTAWYPKFAVVSVSSDNITYSPTTSYPLTATTYTTATLDVSALGPARYYRITFQRGSSQWMFFSEVDFYLPAPEIAVEQPAGTNIASGGAKDFGTVTLGSNTSLEFTIKNTGTADLNLTGTPLVAITGADASDFTVTAQPSTPVTSGGGTTTFTVQFAPGGAGARSATLSIANDDPTDGENPFVINLSGTGESLQTPYEAWSGGNGFNTLNGEGIAYGMAWMLGAGTSTSPSVQLLPAVVPGSGLTMHFKRVHDQGAAKLYFQYSSDLGTWPDPGLLIPDNQYGTGIELATGITATITEGDPDDVTVTVVPAGHEAGGKLFGRLKATEN